MEKIKSILKTILGNTVKHYITSLVGLAILARWFYGFCKTGVFDFAQDAPMILFALFLFTVQDPTFIKDIVKKLLG